MWTCLWVTQLTQSPSLGVKTPSLLLTFSKYIGEYLACYYPLVSVWCVVPKVSPTARFCSQEGGLRVVR